MIRLHFGAGPKPFHHDRQQAKGEDQEAHYFGEEDVGDNGGEHQQNVEQGIFTKRLAIYGRPRLPAPESP